MKLNTFQKEIRNCILLTNLNLDSNQIIDITPLSNYIPFRQLNLCHNKIVDISPLSNYISLIYLDLNSNCIEL